MQTMLNRVQATPLFCVCVFSCVCMAGTPLPDGSSLSLALSKGVVHATVATTPKPHSATLDAALRRALAGATDLFVVGQRGFEHGGHDYLIFATSRPSVPQGGSGYCGAGTEDKLLLAEWQRSQRVLRLRDALEIQSCLKTFELASDQGNELTKVLGDVADPTHLKLTWLNHPEYGSTPRSLVIKNGEFQVE